MTTTTMIIILLFYLLLAILLLFLYLFCLFVRQRPTHLWLLSDRLKVFIYWDSVLLCILPVLELNSLYKPGWPQIYSDLPACATSAGITGMKHYSRLVIPRSFWKPSYSRQRLYRLEHSHPWAEVSLCVICEMALQHQTQSAGGFREKNHFLPNRDLGGKHADPDFEGSEDGTVLARLQSQGDKPMQRPKKQGQWGQEGRTEGPGHCFQESQYRCS